jgi:hypothetical protein
MALPRLLTSKRKKKTKENNYQHDHKMPFFPHDQKNSRSPARNVYAVSDLEYAVQLRNSPLDFRKSVRCKMPIRSGNRVKAK